MKEKRILAIAIGLVLLAVAGNAPYIVSENEQVVITQLGEPIGAPITTAGLRFKIPFIQTANYFEKRIMKWDGNPAQIPTKDKKYIWVDTTARWRIKDPMAFLKRIGSESVAQSRLDGIIDSVVRDHVSNNDLVDLVRSEGWADAKKKLREAGLQEGKPAQTVEGYPFAESSIDEDRMTKGRETITREMLADAQRSFPDFGIELLDIRIKRINYVESVQQKVFDRMISERKRIASQYRSEGEGERAAVLGQMERELARVTSEAFKTSQELRGRADADATRIYAETFGKNADFYELNRTLEAYRNFNNPNSSIVLTTDADIFKYLKNSKGTGK